MNLIDAVKTGLPFRRVGETVWCRARSTTYRFTVADVMADDWEVLGPALRITKEMLYKAHDVQPESFGSEFTNRTWAELINLASIGESKNE